MKTKDARAALVDFAKQQQKQIEQFVEAQPGVKEIFELLPERLVEVLMATKWLEVYRSEVQLASDYDGLRRLAQIGLLKEDSLPSVASVETWKKQIKTARITVEREGWTYNEDSSTFEKRTKGRRRELISECVEAMLDILKGKKLNDKAVKNLIARIFWFQFPRDTIYVRNGKVSNAFKYWKNNQLKVNSKK